MPSGCEAAERLLHTGGAGVSGSAAAAACHVHVAYHGCHQEYGVLNTTFVWHAGYNEWAEPNRIIILYPQALTTVLNPKGCWDWWGYTGKDYASNLGLQLTSIRRMVRALGGLDATPVEASHR